jgi:hypothetical protein
MPGTRDHEALVIEDFQGWWQRGDPESAPSDHFIQADNVQYFQSGVETRNGLRIYVQNYPSEALAIKYLRIYNYITQTGQTLIALGEGGKIWHIHSGAAYGPILTIPAMEDFGFVAINGRAYITPFKNYTNASGEKYQLGIQNEFLYVYLGDGAPARKAAGPPPSGPQMFVQMLNPGQTDPGVHIFAVVYETDTGYITALGPEVFSFRTFPGDLKINISSIPISPNAYVKKRHLVATKTVVGYNGDQAGYQFFFIPGGTLNDNTTTTWSGDFYDSDLISDASHLLDNFSQIPAGVTLNTYHSRLVMVGEYGTTETLTGLPPGITDNRSIVRVSGPGEPESISKVDGLIIAPLDGKALTNVQEFRDVLYIFKNTRTYAYSDNYDVPSSWQEEILDQGIGAPVHGIAAVLDSGGVNTDFLLIVDWSGLMLFNGTYAQPELSWKIEDYWRSLNRNEFQLVQIVNDSINKKIWITLPPPFRKMLLHADYSDGMSPKTIKWARWIFHTNANTIALVETDRLVIGAIGPDPSALGPTL